MFKVVLVITGETERFGASCIVGADHTTRPRAQAELSLPLSHLAWGQRSAMKAMPQMALKKYQTHLKGSRLVVGAPSERRKPIPEG